MATYRELKDQAEKLLQQAEEARQKELATAIDEIKARMDEYGITVRDLGGGRGTTTRGNSRRRPAAIKYRDKAGNTWTGRGRTPRWLQAYLEEGRQVDEFAV